MKKLRTTTQRVNSSFHGKKARHGSLPPISADHTRVYTSYSRASNAKCHIEGTHTGVEFFSIVINISPIQFLFIAPIESCHWPVLALQLFTMA
jgi:hypothetical protein